MAEEILRQGNLESVVLLLVMLMLICNKKKRQVDQKEIKLFGEKKSIKSLSVIEEACAGREVKEISTL